jgi:hypothetical protein
LKDRPFAILYQTTIRQQSYRNYFFNMGKNKHRRSNVPNVPDLPSSKDPLDNNPTLRTAKAISGTGKIFLNVSMALVFICIAITAHVYIEKHHSSHPVWQFLSGGLTIDKDGILVEKGTVIDDTVVPSTERHTVAKAVIEDNAEEVNNIPKGANSAGKPREVSIETCNDRHQQCVNFAAQGECEANPGWMIVNCPSSCNACHLLDPKVRCARDRLGIKEDHVYAPGDMEAMFQSITKMYGDQYGINILSTDPWVVTFDNFLTDNEIDALINSVEGNWERSTDTGTANEFGEVGRVLSQGRTSNNAWCRKECYDNPYVRNVMKKIADITWVPEENFESFQVLRYEIGQLYKTHHDASVQQTRLACGTRILTFFLYLSDVEEGGETAFPSLGIKVRPKKGSALLWPSTLDHEPNSIDHRTVHEARPVIKGSKFAANTWIHSHNYAVPNLMGCTGTFDELTQ